MEFTGKIIAILQPRGGVSKSGNEWKSQEYVIEDSVKPFSDTNSPR